MKKFIKSILSAITVFCIMLTVCTFTSSAASVTVSGGEYNVGSAVKITIRFNADATLYAVEADVSYNSSVLRLNSVSGADYNAGNGTVKIVDDKFTATNPSRTSSYTLNFTAIAAGTSNISVSVLGAGDATSSASSSSVVSVVTPKPSSNANLASLRVNGATLSPAFSSSTTSYTATVGYSIESVTLSAGVADGGATCIGAGTVNLNVGDNNRTVTVTAADGTKKTYTVNIRRMTQEETDAANAAAREANPTLVVIDGIDYNIVKDAAAITVPTGFTVSTEMRKETPMPVLKDDAGEYTLWYITDANGENGGYYTCDAADNFTRISYISANGKIYIVENDSADTAAPEGYISTSAQFGGKEVKAYSSTDPKLSGFYIVYCYVDGTRGYYSYDSDFGTIQRAPAFDPTAIPTVAQPDDEAIDLVEMFKEATMLGKAVVILVPLAVLVMIIIIVLLIVSVKRGRINKDEVLTYDPEDEDSYTYETYELNEEAEEKKED